MSHENPGDGKRCDHCNVPGLKHDTLMANRGEFLCATCLDIDYRKDVHAFTHDANTGLPWAPAPRRKGMH